MMSKKALMATAVLVVGCYNGMDGSDYEEQRQAEAEEIVENLALAGFPRDEIGVLEDGTVYVGSDAGRFHAIAPDGRVRWKLEVDGEADSSAAIAPDGNVVFAAGRSVYAVRPRGDVAWRFEAKGKVFAAPAIGDDGTVFVGSQDDRLYAISSAGVQRWALALGADVDGGPVVGATGEIYVGTDAGDVVRVTPDGVVAWRAALGGYVRGPLALARNGDVLAGVYGPTPRMARVSPAGAVVGEFGIQGTGAKEFGVHGGALEDPDGVLYFGTQDDHVYAVDGEGTVLFTLAARADVDAPLSILSDGTLLVASEAGEVTFVLP